MSEPIESAMLKALSSDQVPSNKEAEEAVIGAVLVNPSAYDKIADFLTADAFYFLKYQYIWQAMVSLKSVNEPIEYLTLTTRLKEMGWLDDVGGAPEITRLGINTPNSTHAEVYARLVERAHVRRQMLDRADKIRALALNESITTEDALSQADKELSEITQVQRTQTSITITDAIHHQLDIVDEARNNPEMVFGIPTGIIKLDEMTTGLRKGRTYYIGARTHQGKTSFMLTASRNAAMLGQRVLWITLEETFEDVTSRLMAIETGLNKDAIATGKMNDQEYARLLEGGGRFSDKHFTIETNTLTHRKIYTRARAEQHRNGVDLLVVDYMQNVRTGNPYVDSNEFQRINEVSHAMAVTARELNIPVMVGVQNNRKNDGSRPELTDFKGSGNIEQDADLAIFLHREGYYKQVDDPDKAEIIVAKNKVNGHIGTVYAYSDPVSFRFSDWSSLPRRP